MEFEMFSKLCDVVLDDIRDIPKDILAAAVAILICENKDFRDNLATAMDAINKYKSMRK